MVLFYKIWKKYNEIQLSKNKMDLEQSKNEKSSGLPWSRRQETSEYGEQVNEAEDKKRVNTVNK